MVAGERRVEPPRHVPQAEAKQDAVVTVRAPGARLVYQPPVHLLRPQALEGVGELWRHQLQETTEGQ